MKKNVNLHNASKTAPANHYKAFSDDYFCQKLINFSKIIANVMFEMLIFESQIE